MASFSNKLTNGYAYYVLKISKSIVRHPNVLKYSLTSIYMITLIKY